MKILVVGGAGYLGGSVTDLLMRTNHELLVYDVLLYEDFYRKKVPFVLGDVRDYAALKKHLAWADAVVWLAAIVGDPACAIRESLTQAVNRDSVRWLRENFSGPIVFMSTCSVYGANTEVLDETSALNPLSLYARTKVEAENILAGSNAVCFRLGTLFGVSDEFARQRFDLVVNTLVMRAVYHGRISVFGGSQFRPLLHVRDVAPAIVRALETQARGIYNLHYDNYKIIDIVKTIENHFPDLKVETTAEQFEDKRNYSVSSAKAKKDLGFAPAVSLDLGIRELKQLLEEKRIKNTFFTRFSNYEHLRHLLAEHPSPLGRELKLEI
ncbi:MAG: NAD(P)-dependent oxidoreductase [Candidatus Firestonebacteria bacterium]|nr:NAD(P)-dependent oxidoreductase [Candidatus Firestonebacteria bacterium]